MWNFFLAMASLTYIMCQDPSQMQDILIESFDPVDLQEDAMNVELLPRTSRSSMESDNAKDHFFRSLRSLQNSGDQPFERSQNVPKPGGLKIYGYEEQSSSRNKRHTPDANPKAPAAHTNTKKPTYRLVKSLGQPLELSVLDPENSTAKIEQISTTTAGMTEPPTTVATYTVEQPESKQEQENVLINDFIRFRRSTNNSQIPKKVNNNTNNNKSGQLFYSNQKPFNRHSEKLVMESAPTGIAREASRVSQEEWVKQAYPGRRNDELSFDSISDSISASTEAIRAPNVHFITQKLSESSNAPEFRSFDREPRAKIWREPYNRAFSNMRDLEGEFSRPIDYYQPRYTRQYPVARHPDSRDDRHYRYGYHPREIYRPRYQNYEMESATNYQKPKQKRIIYYATLPDVSRSPPNVDLRDRYGYRERVRYEDPYRYRKDYPKSRYEKSDRNKTPYPVKVSTDVNVREVKKNPERRIYSEVDNGRYAYKQDPYQANTDNFREN